MSSKADLIPVQTEAEFDKCQKCFASKCCQYITEPIETPRSIRDFDNLLWQVSHTNIHCFKDSNGWYITSYGSCQHLGQSGECLIYDKRPFICREHSNSHCEYDHAEDAFCELYFKDYQAFDEYCRQRFKSWDSRFSKS